MRTKKLKKIAKAVFEMTRHEDWLAGCGSDRWPSAGAAYAAARAAAGALDWGQAAKVLAEACEIGIEGGE